MKNNHSENIPQEVLKEALSKLKEVNTLLEPFLITLTSDQRRSILKMGERTLSFVVNANEYSQQHPELRPSYTSQQDFDIDVADATGLLPVEAILNKLASQINDTAMLAGSEAYNHALLFYNNAKMASKNNVPGAKEIYSDLKTNFPRKRRKSETEE